MSQMEQNSDAHEQRRQAETFFCTTNIGWTKPLFLKLTAQIGPLKTRGVKSKD